MLWSLNYLGLMYCKGTCIDNSAILLPLNHHNFIYLFIYLLPRTKIPKMVHLILHCSADGLLFLPVLHCNSCGFAVKRLFHSPLMDLVPHVNQDVASITTVHLSPWWWCH